MIDDPDRNLSKRLRYERTRPESVPCDKCELHVHIDTVEAVFENGRRVTLTCGHETTIGEAESERVRRWKQ